MSEALYQTDKNDFDQTLDLTKVRPYGDTINDGKTQLSFTLPVPAGDEAVEAAKQLMKKMGFDNPQIVYHKELAGDFTFFVCYGSFKGSVDYTSIHVPKVTSTKWDMQTTDEFIKEKIGRKIVVVGASTGTDAHTVGIDAIMNMKGFAGHFGLERYEMFETVNMGSQVANEDLIAKGIEVKADALLVSQTV
ncbi:MAG: OAM dimerization domain-containing protein, partial [Dysgonamonadaceae bacterium]